MNEVKINVGELPKHESDALCRVLIRSVSEAFKNPKFAAEYEAWKAERDERQSIGSQRKGG